MDDKVKELVEWVAKKVYAKQYAHRHPPWELSWENEKQIYKDACYDLAKQILSHPDLALIDKEVAIIPTLDDFQCRHCNYTTLVEHRIPKRYKPVIPLAEALKESDD